jgi:hypothetical protein
MAIVEVTESRFVTGNHPAHQRGVDSLIFGREEATLPPVDGLTPGKR